VKIDFCLIAPDALRPLLTTTVIRHRRSEWQKSLRISGACVRNPDMEEPAGPIHRSMGKRALVWIGVTEADVPACPSSAG